MDCQPDEMDDEDVLAGRELQLEFIRRLMSYLLTCDNVKMAVECLSLATGICYDGASMTEIAEKHNVSRQYVSDKCTDILSYFQLNPTHHMHCDKSRENYRKSYRKKHGAYPSVKKVANPIYTLSRLRCTLQNQFDAMAEIQQKAIRDEVRKLLPYM